MGMQIGSACSCEGRKGEGRGRQQEQEGEKGRVADGSRDEAANVRSTSHFIHLPNDESEMTQSDLFARQPNGCELGALKERSILEMKKDDEGSRRILMYGVGDGLCAFRDGVSSLFPGGGEGWMSETREFGLEGKNGGSREEGGNG